MDKGKDLTAKIDKAIIESKSKCRVCGEPLKIERGAVYTAKTPPQSGIMGAMGGAVTYYDALDCPQCGCQNILCERKPKADEIEAAAAPESGLNDLAAEIHKNALAHGWWDEPRTFPEIIALCHSELSEGLEEYRNNRPELYFVIPTKQADGQIIPEIRTDYGDGHYDGEKPEGIAVELADCMIRILDYCGQAEIDIEAAIRLKHEYNKSRPYRHGGKKC
jgi:NTP pyrophosphatase (non-canonical NTP hydrolase)